MPRFRFLGPLEVQIRDQWRDISTPKWRSLLAVLLANVGQVISADALVGEVWGYQDPPDLAVNLISIYALRLRQLMGDADGSLLAVRPAGYQLRIGPADTDAQVFQALVRDSQRTLAASDPRSAARLAREALALWRGRPFADVPASPLLERETATLTEQRIYVTELRVTAELACRELRTAETVDELRLLLTAHPFREGLWVLLMQSLAYAGRHAEALEAYGQAKAIISDQFGTGPGPELRNFYGKLLAADSAAARGILSCPGTALPEPLPSTADDPARDRRINGPTRRPRPTPEPRNVASPEDFGRELTAARACAGLTAAEVARTAGITGGQMKAYLAGLDRPLRTAAGMRTLRAVLAACGITTAEDILAWTDALIRAWPETGPSPLAARSRIGTGGSGQAAPVPDAPGFGLCPDPLAARTEEEFVTALADYRVWAGKPSFREMQQACGGRFSAATMCTALRNRSKLPSQQLVCAIVQACGGTPGHLENFVTAWRRLQPRQRDGRPASPPGRRTLYSIPDTA
ncbi:MAG: BTAD domain-containing putative transcriptional regulator [Streptosporangiaceae bacterium]|jgi:DNA-binding SARP family transcriptional activator